MSQATRDGGTAYNVPPVVAGVVVGVGIGGTNPPLMAFLGDIGATLLRSPAAGGEPTLAVD